MIEAGERQAGIGDDVLLADFDEPAVRGQQRETLSQKFTGEGIEHYIDPLAASVMPDGIGKGQRAGIINMLHPECA